MISPINNPRPHPVRNVSALTLATEPTNNCIGIYFPLRDPDPEIIKNHEYHLKLKNITTTTLVVLTYPFLSSGS